MPRVDYQISTNHTLTVRYSYSRDAVDNAGVGGFNLVSRGFHSVRSQTFQATETAVLGSNVVNEVRFQYFRPNTATAAKTPGAALDVLGAFSGGGAPLGYTIDHQHNYEFQNYTSVLRGVHAWRFGVRVRGTVEKSDSPQNFGGTFSFGGDLAPELNAANQAVIDASGQPVLVNIDSIERYRRTLLFQRMGFTGAQIRMLGGGATQFSISAGDPLISASQVDLGAFVSDDWKVRPNLTVSLGLRYETQTNIDDWRNFAPRVGVAWAPGAKSARSKAKSVIRAGFGMFYDRFSLGNTIAALRYNGVVQQQYIITNPDFYPKGVHVRVFQRFESFVEAGTDVGFDVPDFGPVRLFRNEKCVFVRIDQLLRNRFFGHSLGLEVPGELFPFLVEQVAQPLQEQHAENVFLVLRGVHISAEVVAGTEEEAGELAKGELGHCNCPAREFFPLSGARTETPGRFE
jgi:hypothetical protein